MGTLLLPSSRQDLGLSRRSLMGAGAAVCGLALARPVAAALPPPRIVKLQNLHTGEKVAAPYWADGAYLPDGLQSVAKVLRDHRTNDVHAIDPRLLDLLTRLRSKLDTSETFHVISGYRSPASNATLHAASSGVAEHSLHMDGMAIDIRVPGIDLKTVHLAALDLAAGGVGYYEKSQFVHVDVGRVRRW